MNDVLWGAVIIAVVIVLAGVIGNNFFHTKYAALIATTLRPDLAAMETRLASALTEIKTALHVQPAATAAAVLAAPPKAVAPAAAPSAPPAPAPAPLPPGRVGVDAPAPLTYTDYPPATPCTLDANGVIGGGGLQLDQFGRLKSGFRQADYLGEDLTNKVAQMKAAFSASPPATLAAEAQACWRADLNRLGFANGLSMTDASIAAAAACTGPTPAYYTALATKTVGAMTPPVTA